MFLLFFCVYLFCWFVYIDLFLKVLFIFWHDAALPKTVLDPVAGVPMRVPAARVWKKRCLWEKSTSCRQIRANLGAFGHHHTIFPVFTYMVLFSTAQLLRGGLTPRKFSFNCLWRAECSKNQQNWKGLFFAISIFDFLCKNSHWLLYIIGKLIKCANSIKNNWNDICPWKVFIYVWSGPEGQKIVFSKNTIFPVFWK